MIIDRESSAILPISQSGFGLVEFLISSTILLVTSMAVFDVIAQTQRASSYQTEVENVLDNTRLAMDTLHRIISQAGNDPTGASFEGISITSNTEVRLRTDLTGSVGSEKGDPDGDTNDSGEDITFRYNASRNSLEVVQKGSPAQSIAHYISGFSMQYYDATGAPTSIGSQVHKIRVVLTGATSRPNPKTGQIFSQQLQSNVQIATRY